MIIVDWNIKTDPLKIWNYRRDIFKKVLQSEKPDIFCAQEAYKHQVDFLVELNPGYRYIGKGRNAGDDRGEHCPILYNTTTMELRDNGQFWLSKTPNIPSTYWEWIPRICTWGKFKEKNSGKEFYHFNTHMPLPYNFYGKHKAFGVLESELKKFTGLPKVLTGDFNSHAGSWLWKRIHAMGFQKNPHTKATHMPICKIPLLCFDAIFTTPDFSILEYRLLKHPKASDHFGVLAEVVFK